MNEYHIDRQKWQRRSIFEQMGNIYAEVGRTLAAKRRRDTEGATAAAIRAFDLFDATSESLAARKSPKLHELLRARELFADEFISGNNHNIEQYLAPFAIAARLEQFA